MSRSESYGYAVARIRAMEPLLFDAVLFGRLLEADDLAGSVKILSETNYARGFANIEAGARYDSVLEAELLATYTELQSFVPDRALMDLCRIPYDFHNVKVLLKSIFNSRMGGKKRWDLLTSLGTIPVDDLIANVESEDYSLLPYGMAVVLPACVTYWEQMRDVVEVERMLDEQMFRAMLKTAESLEEPGITKWVRARIDAENLRNLLRLKRFGFDSAKAMTFLHDDGAISREVLISLLPEPFESWGRMLSFSDIGKVIASVQDDGNFDNLIVAVEKTLDDFCQSALADARYKADSPENVLAFLWGKEMEIKNIRTILVSKGMAADRDEVRRSLRHGY